MVVPRLILFIRLVRDQANKTLDLYLQRVRKHGNTMAESVLPPPSAVDTSSANNPNAARIGTSNDTSWAGWAISSFTNKLAAADGEIQPTSNGNTPAVAELARPASVPQPTTISTNEPAKHATSSLQAEGPALTRAASDMAAHKTEDLVTFDDDEWGADAWDEGGEGGEAETGFDEDQFFDAGSSPAPTSPAPATTVPYDDGGEPDFAGWLAAQSKSKTKKALPKGLNKTGTSKDLPVRSATTSRTATSRAPAKPAKVIDTTPKDEGEEDGWGDAW
jgi:SCY1-like protein 1